MKTLNISRSQFQRLNEIFGGMKNEDLPIIDVSSETETDAPEAGMEAAKEISANGAKAARIRVTPNSGNVGDNIEVSGNEGNDVSSRIEDASRSAAAAGIKNPSFIVNVDDAGKPVREECKIYSKKMVEESRIREIRKNGYCLTKAELRKKFM